MALYKNYYYYYQSAATCGDKAFPVPGGCDTGQHPLWIAIFPKILVSGFCAAVGLLLTYLE